MLYLITGGSGSGKSEYAENLAVSLGDDLIYIATMQPFDDECRKRIKRHQIMRERKNFKTIECYISLGKLLLHKDMTVLLECMSNLVANEMYREDGAREHTVDAILKDIDRINSCVKNLIIVTNEVFSDGSDYDSETIRYLSYLGKINQRIGKMADRAWEVVYSIPIAISSLEGGKHL